MRRSCKFISANIYNKEKTLMIDITRQEANMLRAAGLGKDVHMSS